jgi:hypothetical protein
MKKPPFPTDKPIMHPHRLEHSLTRPAPAVSGAALHPVLLRNRQTELGSGDSDEVDRCSGLMVISVPGLR